MGEYGRRSGARTLLKKWHFLLVGTAFFTNYFSTEPTLKRVPVVGVTVFILC